MYLKETDFFSFLTEKRLFIGRNPYFMGFSKEKHTSSFKCWLSYWKVVLFLLMIA
ncbi:hypothetical protein FCR2A7T_06460 [Flavobacterium cauense R2A-7]|nr:hypothetical protein FCR2A7T_06460 [Flavobacterium cauense R2A-7]